MVPSLSGNPAYSAAKAGVISFTQTLAIEYGPKGIRANGAARNHRNTGL